MAQGVKESNNGLSLSSRKLPEGKEFHLFFSHSSEDFREVDKLISTLEEEPYNLKCCSYKRDFIAGAPLLKNFGHFITVSVKTVIVLTPDFVESGFCEQETSLAVQLSCGEKKNIVIPYLLKPCNVPDALKMLKYINGMEEGAVHELARLADLEPEIYQTPYQVWIPKNHNAPFTCRPKVSKNYFIDGHTYAYYFHPPNDAEKELIRKSGIKLTSADMDLISKIVNSSNVALKRWVQVWLEMLFFCILLYISSSPLTAGIFTSFLEIDSASASYGFRFPLFSDQAYSAYYPGHILALVLWILGYFGCIKIQHSLKGRDIWKRLDLLNQHFYKKNVLVHFNENNKGFSITYQKLEYGSCKHHVKGLIEQALQIDTEAEVQFDEKEPDRILRLYVAGFARSVWIGDLKTNETRHTTNFTFCLCQYIEEKRKFDYKDTLCKKLFQICPRKFKSHEIPMKRNRSSPC